VMTWISLSSKTDFSFEITWFMYSKDLYA
jgi:hypothetical protein